MMRHLKKLNCSVLLGVSVCMEEREKLQVINDEAFEEIEL
jgi:hypothetical protein